MSIGGPVLRQHVVEFIDGTGIKTDGIVDTSDTATPFSWTVPNGTTKLYVTGCGGGGGGSTGNTNATSSGGGGGGGSALSLVSFPVDVVSGTTLTIALGAGGISPALGTFSGPSGGNTTISPVTTAVGNINSTTFVLVGGGAQFQPSGSNGRVGGLAAFFLTQHGSASGLSGSANSILLGHSVIGGGSAGGNANATGSIAGSAGASMNASYFHVVTGTTPAGGAGGTNGTKSTGGGGAGGSSLFGNGGNGGGNAAGTSQNGTNATGYGAGGGGCGGGGVGGNGTKGYVRFVYWSFD